MSGTVDIFTQTVANTVAVPIAAVTVRDFNKIRADTTKDEEALAAIPTTEDLRKVVFVHEDGEAKMVEVETGIADDTYIEVRSGLAAGTQVVSGPYSAVSRTFQSLSGTSEMAKFKPFDKDGVVPNSPMTWGVMPWKGNFFFSDMNSEEVRMPPPKKRTPRSRSPSVTPVAEKMMSSPEASSLSV